MNYEQHYKFHAENYNELRLDRENEIETTSAIIQRYIVPSDGKLLDAGCGTGRYSVALQALGYVVTGLDQSIDQLKQVPSNIETVHCSMLKTPFGDDTFACAMLILSLHQLSKADQLKAIREMRRIIQPNGYLIIKTCSLEDLNKRRFNDLFPSAIKINRARYLPIADLKELIETNSFKNVFIQHTKTSQAIEVKKLIRSIKMKHNTTLALIPEEEFVIGCSKLDNYFNNNEIVMDTHHHTIVIAQKG